MVDALLARHALLSGFIVCCSPPSAGSFWCQGLVDGESPVWSAPARHVGRRQRQRSAGAQRRVAGTGVGPGVQDQDDGLVEGAAPRVEFATRVSLGAAVVLTVAAQAAESGGITAGFGEEVPA